MNWLPLETAPEEEYVILAVTDLIVGEAIMERAAGNNKVQFQRWYWTGGDLVEQQPLGWQRLPEGISEVVR